MNRPVLFCRAYLTSAVNFRYHISQRNKRREKWFSDFFRTSVRGTKKIPDLAKALGKAKSEFKKGIAEGEKEEAELEKDLKPEEPAKELV